MLSSNSAEAVNGLSMHDLKLFLYDAMRLITASNDAASGDPEWRAINGPWLVRDWSASQYGAIAAGVALLAARGHLYEFVARRYAGGARDELAGLALCLYAAGYSVPAVGSDALRRDCQAAHAILSGLMRIHEAGNRDHCFGSAL